MACENCGNGRAILIRPKNRKKVCKECFFELFERDIHDIIAKTNMFPRGSRVGIGISGGKDSTVLAYVLNKLNKQFDYGLELVLLCVDEGIAGYRDQSIATVLENKKALGLDLQIVSFTELYGVDIDGVVKRVGRKGTCSYCGTFRRQALEDAARKMNVDCIVTGHNADDMAETIIMNFLRGDYSRLVRCTLSRTSSNSSSERTSVNVSQEPAPKYLSLPRCKPFKYIYQKEIVFYAYFKKLLYFSTECTYAPGASRGDARSLIKDLEKCDSRIILKIIAAGEELLTPEQGETCVSECNTCSHPTSSTGKICAACKIVTKLAKLPIQ
ncbi:cytoplasmic tRNA 2-thiolation protein 1 [Pancytospora epiphaga]|nr:cytoplasmic tRNA 2-thiolation protein 1 [Pancytospora epiphaga]